MSDHGEQKARALPATELAPPEPRWRERLIARLMEALRPFAAASEKWRLADVGTMLDTQRVMVDVGDLRRAQAALDHASQVAWEARAGAEPAPAPEPAPPELSEETLYSIVARFGAASHKAGQESVRQSGYQPRAEELLREATTEVRAAIRRVVEGGPE
jgi:hypothetical protein